eukprot:728312_1
MATDFRDKASSQSSKDSDDGDSYTSSGHLNEEQEIETLQHDSNRNVRNDTVNTLKMDWEYLSEDTDEDTDEEIDLKKELEELRSKILQCDTLFDEVQLLKETKEVTKAFKELYWIFVERNILVVPMLQMLYMYRATKLVTGNLHYQDPKEFEQRCSKRFKVHEGTWAKYIQQHPLLLSNIQTIDDKVRMLTKKQSQAQLKAIFDEFTWPKFRFALNKTVHDALKHISSGAKEDDIAAFTAAENVIFQTQNAHQDKLQVMRQASTFWITEERIRCGEHSIPQNTLAMVAKSSHHDKLCIKFMKPYDDCELFCSNINMSRDKKKGGAKSKSMEEQPPIDKYGNTIQIQNTAVYVHSRRRTDNGCEFQTQKAQDITHTLGFVWTTIKIK